MEVERVYRGIKFIRLSDLSEDLQDAISNWLNDDIKIKIKTDEALYSDCILVKDFEFWYQNIYTPVNDLTETGKVTATKRASIKFAFER